MRLDTTTAFAKRRIDNSISKTALPDSGTNKGSPRAALVVAHGFVPALSLGPDSVLNYLHTEGVALVDLFDEVEALGDLAKAGVVAVEVGGVLTVVNDEELGAASVSACVGHAQHPLVMKLVLTVELAVDGVARSAAADALRTPTLGHKPGDDAVELEAFVETFFGKLDEVGHRVGGVLLKKLHGHRAVVGVNLGVHAAKMHHSKTKKSLM